LQLFPLSVEEIVRNQILSRQGIRPLYHGRERAKGWQMEHPERSKIRRAIQRVLSWIRRASRKEPEQPQDPYAYVTAPRKPITPNRSAAAVAELPEE
jgi:hypothetical protein